MDQALLERYLAEGYSLTGIGALTGHDPSTVGYWMRKHGLVANGRDRHSPRGPLARDQLQPLVESGATLRQIAVEVDRSVSTVRHWLKRYGLRTARRDRRDAALATRKAGLTRFASTCHRHGDTEFLAFPGGRSRCARCNAAAVASFRRRVKRVLIDEAGGACRICGYSSFQGALHFHHLDPDRKLHALSSEGYSRSLTRARAEARKCILLCANCHAEVEGGVARLPLQ